MREVELRRLKRDKRGVKTTENRERDRDAGRDRVNDAAGERVEGHNKQSSNEDVRRKKHGEAERLSQVEGEVMSGSAKG